jgi:hypothetical protein
MDDMTRSRKDVRTYFVIGIFKSLAIPSGSVTQLSMRRARANMYVRSLVCDNAVERWLWEKKWQVRIQYLREMKQIVQRG